MSPTDGQTATYDSDAALCTTCSRGKNRTSRSAELITCYSTSNVVCYLIFLQVAPFPPTDFIRAPTVV